MSETDNHELCRHDAPQFELTCPSCGGAMHHIRRSNACIDECEDCNGVYLSRDELLQLVAGEAAHYSRPHEKIEEAARLQYRRSYDTELPYLVGLLDLDPHS